MDYGKRRGAKIQKRHFEILKLPVTLIFYKT